MKPVLWNRSLSRPAHPCVGFFSLLTTNQVASLILFGSAILENERPPLTSVAGQRAVRHPATARDALQNYRRMGTDLKRRGQIVDAEIAHQ